MAERTLEEAAQWMRERRARLGWSAADAARKIVEVAHDRGVPLTLTQQAVSHFENGRAKTLPSWLGFFEAAVGEPQHLPATEVMADSLDLVGIASVDQDYGMGLTFADSPVEVEVMHFPRVWIEALTPTPAALLTWARGRGDSMSPTINDNDLVLIDRSDRRVEHQDVLWAFTIGDTAMIKRLRVRGENVTILSDASHVPPDQAHVDEINIVGRVAYVLKRV